jgi:hypothetical protein
MPGSAEILATAGMPVIAGTQARAVTQATVVQPKTSRIAAATAGKKAIPGPPPSKAASKSRNFWKNSETNNSRQEGQSQQRHL